MNPAHLSIGEIAASVRAGTRRVEDIANAALTNIAAGDNQLNCFVDVQPAQILNAAKAMDKKLQDGTKPGRLAGVPFAVKDLLDVKGETTKAGAKLREFAPPARANARLVARLRRAGALYIGRLNMDEFAYGFATVNTNYGTTRNPHDTECLAGGSSGGSAAAVAASLVPLTLGSDTNGSIRVPASLCGVFGLRPTHGALPMDGVFPFVEQLDTVGPFTRTIEDLADAFWVLAARRAPKRRRIKFNVARLDGWFRAGCDAEALAGVDAAADIFGQSPLLNLPTAEAGRSAAFLITARTGGRLHQQDLQSRAMAYDPAVRDRLIAGCTLTDDCMAVAEHTAKLFNAELTAALDTHDVLIAPSTPTAAPRISDGLIDIGGKMVSARANLGLYTQPLSLAGVPILSVPLKRPGKLPLGIQLIAGRGKEAVLFDAARCLVEADIVGASPPNQRTIGAA